MGHSGKGKIISPSGADKQRDQQCGCSDRQAQIAFNEKYGTNFEKNAGSAEIFEKIAVKRGYLLKAGQPDIEKAQTLILNDFKNGKICKVRLD